MITTPFSYDYPTWLANGGTTTGVALYTGEAFYMTAIKIQAKGMQLIYTNGSTTPFYLSVDNGFYYYNQINGGFEKLYLGMSDPFYWMGSIADKITHNLTTLLDFSGLQTDAYSDPSPFYLSGTLRLFCNPPNIDPANFLIQGSVSVTGG